MAQTTACNQRPQWQSATCPAQRIDCPACTKCDSATVLAPGVHQGIDGKYYRLDYGIVAQ